jgi:multicomponent Na+:H+ antiporter subunit F
MTLTNAFFLFVLSTVAGLIGVYLYRVIYGPTVFDRVLGLNGISTKAIILLVLIGTIYGRVDMFVDISTGYALLNLVSALGIAKYLEERGGV